jgi:5-deoxy-D-glucuronate isomerase
VTDVNTYHLPNGTSADGPDGPYDLNVMAGPGQDRAWLICDDPAHGWVRTTWAAQYADPRLPFGGEEAQR